MRITAKNKKNRLTRQDKLDINRESIFKDIADVIASPSLANDKIENARKNADWIEMPLSLYEFCKVMLNEELFDEQLNFGNVVVGENPTEFPETYIEHLAYWGKGAGKDRTVAKLQVYMIYKLMCLRNPQHYLRTKYNCSIADGDSIDIANVSITARQAENVYFKKFKNIIKMVKDKDGGNWFENRGVSLEDGVDLKEIEAIFPHAIVAHSLNSETNTGEGLNLLFAAIDEFGGWKGVENATNLLDNIRSSAKSRFKKIAKICVMSYNYYPNDPMDLLYKNNLNNDSVYKSKKKTWEVNPHLKKSDFADEYRRNPEKAARQYECKSKLNSGGYITKKYMLAKMFTQNLPNPFVGDVVSCHDTDLLTIQFKDEFLPLPDAYYIIHADLATGRKSSKNDCAGFSMSHMNPMIPKLDSKLKKEMASEGIIIDEFMDEYLIEKKGVAVDLALQLTSKTEIEFSNIRYFISRLQKRGFNIYMVTFDGWESRDSIQILNRMGIEATLFSVDRTNEHYDLWKSLMYQQLCLCYPHYVAQREANELIITDKGKVDHPEKSYERIELEGTDKGSKDVLDCIVANCAKIYEEFELDSGIGFS